MFAPDFSFYEIILKTRWFSPIRSFRLRSMNGLESCVENLPRFYPSQSHHQNAPPMRIRQILVACLLLCFADLFAQGCADAGFCSVNAIRPEQKTDTLPLRNRLKAGLSVGNTRYNVWILNPYLEYSHHFSEKLDISVKVDANHRWGQLTQVTGFSDVILSASWSVQPGLRMIAGLKAPLATADRKYEARTLPMAYQTTMGTYDGIVGLQYRYKKFIFVSAWQQPFVQNNNDFRMRNFTEVELGHIYPETNGFRRAGDVLLRVSYLHTLRKQPKLSLIYSLLPIYHLKDDSYVDENQNTVALEGSRGLTLNLNAFATYKFHEKWEMEFTAGFPLRSRKVRPEGLAQFGLVFALTRKW